MAASTVRLADGPIELVAGSVVSAPSAVERAAALPMPLPRGSVLLYDSRIWHRGGANQPGRGRERPVWYVTLLGAHGMPPAGLPYTIEPDEAACMHLTPRGVRVSDAQARCGLVGRTRSRSTA